MGTGPLLSRMAWRAAYTQASSLAFRAQNPIENFTDQGVGLGRSLADNDQLTLRITAPLSPRWLIAPELTLLRQGEGDLNSPFPTGTAAGATPTLFIGTRERTWRAALGLSGQQGPLALTADAGLHYIQNEDHAAGRNRTRFLGRVRATVGLGRKGHF
jgi:hypothetical protein